MSLSDNYKPVKYIGNGTTKDFSFNFNMINREYCRVFLEDKTTGAQTPKNLDADYSLVFDDNGGQVSMKVAPLASQYIVVYRDVDLNQKSDFRVGEGFAAVKIEDEFDKQMAAIQQMDDGLNRSPKVAEGYSGSLTLPNPVAGKALIWNENENGFKNSTVDVDHLEAITQQYRDEAEAARDAARVSENNAKASENAAKASQTAAASSAQSAANTVNGFDAHAAEKQSAFDTNAAQKTQAFNDNAQSKTNTFNTNAAQKQAAVDASAENARKWAVGTIQEQPKGSAKYWAENAKAVTEGTLNETQITNCITKIPQDIKLELSNGTLTLKAGSKVYVPNGVGRFDEVVIQQDTKINTHNTASGKFLACYRVDDKKAWGNNLVTNCGSGTDATGVTGFYYRTDTNKLDYYNNGIAEGHTWSLPICILDSTKGTVTSIDQVFNGFGYIGGTVFALPGVEGLIPNGRNIDGSLNNIKLTTTSVFTYTPTTGTKDVLLILTSDRFYWNSSARYDTENNYNINAAGIIPQLILGYENVVSGKITSFNPKLPIKIADDQEVVHLSQEETISGIKNFKTSINTKPKSLSVPNLNGYDLDGNKVGDILIGKSSNGNFYSILRINKQDGSFGAQVGLRRDSSNNIYLEGITPSATDNSTKLATTAWVRQYGIQVNYAAGVTISSGATISANGLLLVVETSGGGFHRGSLSINSQKIINWITLDGTQSTDVIPVRSGDVITFTSASNVTLYPFI